jgi:4-hydroxy-tetrahydrodipicolinate synthase
MLTGNTNTKFDRLYTATVTPYKSNFDVDEGALRNMLQYFVQPKFVNAGGAIIINPAAGELPFLTREEKRRNVEIAVECCGDKVPVFAGALDLRTEDTVKVAVDAKKAGADGIFVFPPIGSALVTKQWDSEKYPEVWIDMVKAVSDAVELPMITHPAVSHPVFGGFAPKSTLEMCRQIPNIVGWKMTYNYQGTRPIVKALRSLDHHVAILAARGSVFHEYLANGYFDGALTGSFNYAMEQMVDHIEAWKRKDLNEASRIWESGLSELHTFVYEPRYSLRYKIGCWLRGLIPLPFMRPPQPRPRKDEVQKLRQLMVDAGIDVIPERNTLIEY